VEISEVRIKLMDDPHERLQAFCSITFDSCFVIRDLKIIQGAKGSFVAMPSRKLTDRCPRCHCKNHLRALHCNQCGAKLDEDRAIKDNEGRAKLYADIAHPINSDCRELIQRKVLEAYEDEIVRSKEPGYCCTYDDYGEEHFATLREPFDDVEYETPRVVRTQETSRRIEPAAAQPGPPHQNVPAAARVNAAAHAQQRSARQDDDNFGAGID
jgi:stage V sporulation protein G